MARSSALGEQIVSLVDEVETDARVAAKNLPPTEVGHWLAVGNAPLLSKACLADARALAEKARELGQHIDVDRIFLKAMGPRAWSLLSGLERPR